MEDGWGPCACPRGSVIPLGLRVKEWFTSDEDKHKAPTSTLPHPLSLQDEDSWDASVPTITITLFGWQNSSVATMGDVYWDEIISIEPDGEAEVYDLTVEGLHNFVAGDIVVHN